MSWSPEIVAVFCLGMSFSLVILLILTQLVAKPDQSKPIPPRLPAQEFTRRIEASRKGYLDSMAQYDRLIPWASAGALVISFTFVSEFSQLAVPWTKWILAAAWLALAGALLCSIFSQYASTRIKVWSMRILEAAQDPPSRRAPRREREEWEAQIREFQAKAQARGRDTRLLNELSGVLLVFGLVALGAFALIAVPFGPTSLSDLHCLAA